MYQNKVDLVVLIFTSIVRLLFKYYYPSKKNHFLKKIGAWVICEPWFTGSRYFCELWKYVNHKSKFTEKSCEPGSQKFGSLLLE